MLTYNFSKVDDNLYRGGAPLPQDIVKLYNDYGIRKIISLDKDAGRNIRHICKKLHINHIEIPINHKLNSETINKIVEALSNINEPTYIHCKWGKDRTGMLVAMYRCMHGWSFNDAIKEANKFHFGRGMPSQSVAKYKDAVRKVYNLFNQDTNSVKDDIVTQERDNFDKGMTPPAANPQQSFSPFLDPQVITLPYASAQNYFSSMIKTAQFEKKLNRKDKLKQLLLTLLSYIDSDDSFLTEEKEESVTPGNVPQLGQYDNYSGVKGVGPVETGGYAQI